VNTRIAFFISALALLTARSASAQPQDNGDAYQIALLGGTLSASDQKICDGKGNTKDIQDACRVTRLLLIDLGKRPPQDKGVPALANIKYTVSPAEAKAIGDLYTKYGY
jgi:hypothetical protein